MAEVTSSLCVVESFPLRTTRLSMSLVSRQSMALAPASLMQHVTWLRPLRDICREDLEIRRWPANSEGKNICCTTSISVMYKCLHANSKFNFVLFYDIVIQLATIIVVYVVLLVCDSCQMTLWLYISEKVNSAWADYKCCSLQMGPHQL